MKKHATASAAHSFVLPSEALSRRPSPPPSAELLIFVVYELETRPAAAHPAPALDDLPSALSTLI
jgi:hypothetical protein